MHTGRRARWSKSKSRRYTEGEKGLLKMLNTPRPFVRINQKATASFVTSVHELRIVRGVNDIIGQVDQELSETALGSGIITQNGGEGSITQRLGQALAERLASASVVAQPVQSQMRKQRYTLRSDLPKKAAHNVLQQADRLLFDKLIDHVAEDSAYSVEALVGLTDVGEANVVKQYLLDDENGHSLAELRARLHDAQTERNDLGREQEVDDFRRVVLDKSANYTERRQA